MSTTRFEEDELVEATAPNVSAIAGDRGRVIETGDHMYHRVYWPRLGFVAYHLGSALRRLGKLGG